MKTNIYVTVDETSKAIKPVTGTVSDWITANQVNKWCPGDIKMICAGTGAGKSYFMRNIVCDCYKRQGKRILYLMPRTKIKEQFQKELDFDKSIDLMTYQSIEEIQNDPKRELSQWDVIICDEAHYFLSDSGFNRRTDLSFGWIMEQKGAIKVFLTATDAGISRYLQEQGVEFEKFLVPISQKQIKSLSFFWSNDNLDALARRIIKDNGKAIFFLQSAKTAYAMYEKFSDRSFFLCSQHNGEFSRFMDADAITAMIERERFECNLLFTTTALDTGITIKDQGLTTIVVDVADPSAIVQCIGRKRFVNNADTLNIYIHGRTQQQIGGILRKCYEKETIARNFMESGAVEFAAAHNRGNDSEGMVVDVQADESKPVFKKQLNLLRYSNIKYQIEIYQEILNRKDGYIGYVAELLGCQNYSILENPC